MTADKASHILLNLTQITGINECISHLLSTFNS